MHRRFEHAGSLPLFQMKAKNAGIRRARGRFVLATNIDIVLSAQLAAYIGARKLQPGRLYRVERHDISPAPPVGAPLDAVLNFCESHVIRVNRRDASIDTRDGVSSPVYPKRHRVLGHLPRDLLRDIAHGVMPWTRNGRANIRASWSYIHDEFARPRLMTNASGDFMLMDRDSWFDLHGYAEWDIYSFHLDAIFCHQAAASGRREAFLEPPRLVWHIEHARGSGFVPEDPDSLWRRLEAAGVPWLEGERAQQIIRDLHRSQMAPAINDGNWGLAGLDLEERLLADAGEAS